MYIYIALYIYVCVCICMNTSLYNYIHIYQKTDIHIDLEDINIHITRLRFNMDRSIHIPQNQGLQYKHPTIGS